MTVSPVRFGLIGFGAWGKCHADAIAKTDGANLVAITARSNMTRTAAGEAYPEATICADYHELANRNDVDVVDIFLPTFLHHEVSVAVLRSGKNLLLEKPMCPSVGQCNELIRLAQEKSRVLAIGHELRLSSLWGRVKEMIADGFVGIPQYVLVELSRQPYRLGAEGWRYDINRVGNWILEEPIHFFDLIRWYLASSGDPESIFAVANSRQAEHAELQDNFSATVKFHGAAYAIVTQTLSAFEHHQTVKVIGTEGSLWAGWSGAMDRTRHPEFFLKASDGKDVREIPIKKMTGELFELEDQMVMLVRALREAGPLTTTPEDGRWSVAMCVAAQRLVETGHPVRMDQVMAHGG